MSQHSPAPFETLIRQRVPGEQLHAAVPAAVTLVGLVASVLWLGRVQGEAGLEWLGWSQHDAHSAQETRAHAATSSSSAVTPTQTAMPDSASSESASRPPTLAAAPAPGQTTPEVVEPAAHLDCQPLVVTFASGAKRISEADELRLTALAQHLQRDPQAMLLVRGHADPVGSDAYNLRLSFQRAEAVANSLAAHGIARQRISVQGFGEYAPLDGVAPSEAINRRATVNLRAARHCPSGGDKP